MAEERGRYDWEQTAAIISTILNVNRAVGTKVIDPDEINPYISVSERKAKRPVRRVKGIGILHEVTK